MLVVREAVAPPDTVIMLHHVCDQMPLPHRYGWLHHELHGHEHFTALPTRKGAGDVIHNEDEQSALHPPLPLPSTARLSARLRHNEAARRSPAGRG